MKKIVSFLMIITVILFYSNVTFAATKSFGAEVTSTKTTVNPGDQITVTFKVNNINNIPEGLWALQANLQYDNSVLEMDENSIKAFENWATPTINTSTGAFVTENGVGVKNDSNVFSVVFKIKDNAQVGNSTTITIKNIEASDDYEDISANSQATVTLNIVAKQTITDPIDDSGSGTGSDTGDNTGDNSGDNTGSNTGDNTGDNTGSNTGNNSGSETGSNAGNNNDSSNNGTSNNTGSGSNSNNANGSNGSASNNNADNTSKDSKLPQTGENDYIIIVGIVGAILLIGISYLGYRKYRNI